MAEVGVLNLTIKDNSSEAAEGLGYLATVLTSVKNAVKGGYGNVDKLAKAIETISRAVNDHVHGSTIAKLSELGDAISKMKGMGPIHITIRGDGIDKVRTSAQRARESVDAISTGFENVSSSVQGFVGNLERGYEMMQNMGWNGGYEQFVNMFNAWSSDRSARALPGTSALSTEVEKGWTEWKNGAIEVEGTVTDSAIESIGKIEESASQLKLEAPQTLFSSIEEAARYFGITVEEVKQKLQETYEYVYGGGGGAATPVFSTLEEAAASMGISVDEAKERVKELQETLGMSSGSSSTFEGAMEKIYNAAMDTEQRIDLLREKLALLEESMEEGISKGSWSPMKIVNTKLMMDSIEKQIAKLEGTERLKRDYGMEMVQDLANYSKQELLGLKKQGLMNDLASDINANNVTDTQVANRMLQINAIDDQIAKLDEYEQKVEEAENTTKSFKDSIKDLFKSMKDNSLGKLISQFARLAKYRILRNILKHIGAGLKEGIENVYEYSKAVGTSFAPTMDSLKATMSGFKNSLGAALAPALQAIIPILNQIVSAAITVINVLSQLFSLLGGHGTWTRAKYASNGGGVNAMATSMEGMALAANSASDAVVKSMDEIDGAAGGASDSMKEMLASFDELTVIASQSGGGGGGGGGGDAMDFAGMFEEVPEFDENIQRIAAFIKDLIGWIKDNLNVVLATVGLIGTAILGWKISQAFEGALATLGKLIAGASLVTLGVILDFDFGAKLGASVAGGSQLKWEDIVEGIAGIVAAGIGGYIIGGGAGAMVGITLAIAATLVGFVVGYEDQKDKMRWGQNSLTPEQIEAYLIEQFKFDVYAELRIADASITNTRVAKIHLDSEIAEFSRNLDKIKLGVDTSPAAIEVAKNDADKVIAQLKEYLSTSANLVDVLFQNNDYGTTNEQGIQKDILAADAEILGVVEGLGKQIADAYDAGMSSGWKNNEAQQIADLMEHLENIMSAADSDMAYGRFLASSRAGITGLSRDTAEAVLAEQKKVFGEFEETIASQNVEAVEALYRRASIVEKLGNQKLADQLRDDAAKLIDAYESGRNEKLQTAKDSMKNEWRKALGEIYNEDYTNKLAGKLNHQWGQNLKQWSHLDAETATQFLRDTLDTVLKANNVTTEAAELFDITGWDLLGNTAKKNFFNAVYSAVKNDAVALIHNATGISAFDLFDISGWDQFSSEQQVNFLKAMSDVYGSSEAVRALNSHGVDIAAMIAAGMESNDPAIRKAAEDWKAAIDQILNGDPTDVSVETDEEALNKTKEKIKSVIEGINPKISAMADLTVSVSGTINIWANIAGGAINKATGFLKDVMTNISSQVPGYATGGFPKQGDLFLANEAGAEYIGSIGGKPAVANTEQIVQGISSGVRSANEEQNALLKEQNELLRRLLEKETTVNIGGGVGFGRMVEQSLNMFNLVKGG